MGAGEDDINALRAALAAAEAKAAEAARLQAVLSSAEAVIAALQLEIAKPNLDSERRGPGSRPLRSLCFPGWRAASRENVVPRPAA